MLRDLQWERRRLRRELATLTHIDGRYRSFAAEFVPVGRSAEGEPGALRMGGAWVAPVGDPLREGGTMDILGRRWESTEADDVARFYYAASQTVPLMFGDPSSQWRRMVVVGSMGAGKTEIGSRWLIRMGFRFRNAAIGVVAPTHARLKIIWKKITRLLKPEWITDIRIADNEIHLVNGVRFEFVSAKEASKATGSPIAGKDWVAALVDEEQDVDQTALDELEMRGRDAPNGYFPVLSTCTLKDSPEWRERKQRYEAQPDCVIYRMTLADNPFVDPSYIEHLAHSLSPRAYRMRVLALDARPERATYPDFDRARHVARLPELGVRDVTDELVGSSVLIGHDPGALKDFSVLLKAFAIGGGEPCWWVVGEVCTEPGNTERHAADLASAVRVDLAVEPSQCLIRADPFGNTPSNNRPDRTIYTELHAVGFRVMPAVYKANPSLTTAHKPGVLPIDSRIAVVNRLLMSQSGRTRLYLMADQAGNPIATQTAASLEVSERDEAGKAERYRKDKYDPSHPTAALGYALYSYEKPRVDRARAEG